MDREKETEKKEKLRNSFFSGLCFPQLSQQQWVVVLLLGVLLVLLSVPAKGTGKKEKSEGTGSANFLGSFDSTFESGENGQDEKSALERKMEVLLSGVEGVGETQVLLVTQEDADADYFGKGEQKVTGVLISARGAGNSVIIQNIKEAVMALFQIDAHRIKVMKMK